MLSLSWYQPAAGARDEETLRCGRRSLTDERNGNVPCRFREQTKRVNVREDANLVSMELILAALFALGGGGFKPVHHFGFDGVAVGMLLALEKFPFVAVEIIVDAVKLAPEIILLAAKNSGEVGFEFVAENRAKVVGPRGKIRCRPGEMRRIGFGFSEREVF